MIENSNYYLSRQPRMPMLRLLILSLVLLWAAGASAARVDQDMQHLRQLGNVWLEQQAAQEWPDVLARAQTGGVDERLRLPACADLHFSLAAGARLGNSGSVKAQCGAPHRWSLYLSFRIRLAGPVVVARRELPARALLSEDDLEIRVIDFERPLTDYLKEPALAIGARASQRIPAGYWQIIRR